MTWRASKRILSEECVSTGKGLSFEETQVATFVGAFEPMSVG